ncbi:MAG: hypothetical protein IIB56_18305 [Planctomycetes bacterium]|nr:hypothetical protein [Planctomycetota bacterium]
MWIFVSTALDEYDFINIVKLVRKIFQRLAENAAVEDFERGEIRECYRRYKEYGFIIIPLTAKAILNAVCSRKKPFLTTLKNIPISYRPGMGLSRLRIVEPL